MALGGACVFSVSILGGFKMRGFCSTERGTGVVAGFAKIVVMWTGAESAQKLAQH